jgi:hypothetical protein
MGNVTKRRTARWRSGWLAWLAIAALLIDGVLPSAVSLAMAHDRAAPISSLCGAATGQPGPNRTPATLPTRHCALCCGPIHAIVPAFHPGAIAPLPTGRVDLATLPLTAPRPMPPDYQAAQPRAPPGRV